MNLNLNEEKIRYICPVCRCRFTREETMEVIVPDSMPDILRIVDADAVPLLRGKDADIARMTVSGVADAAILYVPESGENVMKLAVNIPFSATYEDADITPDSLLTAKVSLASVDSRAINPRKLLIKLELCYDMGAYTQCEKKIANGVEDARDDVQMLKASTEMMLPSSVSEKTFVLTDELSMPPSRPAVDEILKYAVRMNVDDCKAVGKKALAKGTVYISALYRSRDGGVEKAEFTSQFSQIIETESPVEPERNDVLAMPTGIYLSRGMTEDSGGETLSLEMHSVLQCVSYSKTDIDYIADAYSTKYELNAGYESLHIESGGEENTYRTVLRGTVSVPNPESAVMLTAKTGLVNKSEKDGAIILSAPVFVSIIYSDANGTLSSVCRKFEVSCETVNASDSADATAEWNGEANISATREGFEISIPIEFKISGLEAQELNIINDMELDDEKPLDISKLPSLTVHRVAPGDSMWDLGKKYMSAEDVILTANGLEDANSIAAGDILIIPKKR